RLAPDLAGAKLGMATVQMQRGDLDGAEELVKRARELAPDSAGVWYAKGKLKFLRSEHRDAVGFYDKCIVRDPQHLMARKSRAASLMTLSLDGLAKVDIEFVRDIVPDDPQAAYLHALLLARGGEVKEAQFELRNIAHVMSGLDRNFVSSHGPTQLLLGTIEFLQNHIDKAEVHLERYVRRFPGHAAARKLLGEVLLRKREFKQAIWVLEPLVGTSAEDFHLLTLLGNAYMQGKRYPEATKVLEKAAAMAPDQAGLRMQLALSRLADSRPHEAMEDLEAALEVDSSAVRAGLLLGNLQIEQGQYLEALNTAKRLQVVAPDNPVPFNLAGTANMSLANFAAARASFKQALSLNPAYRPARLNLASLEKLNGNLDQAAAHYQELLKLDVKGSQAMVGMARIAEREGRLTKAIEWLEKLRNMKAPTVPQLQFLADLYLRTGNPRESLVIAEGLEKRALNDPKTQQLKGRAHLALGEHSQAAKVFRTMYGFIRESPPWLARIARHQMAAEDLEGAGHSLGKALEIDPNYLPAQEARVLLDLRNGKPDLALAHATELRMTHPEVVVGDTLMGDVLLRQGAYAKAVRAYSNARKKRSTTDITMRLYRAYLAGGRDESAQRLLEDWLDTHPGDYAVRVALAVNLNEKGQVDFAQKQWEYLLQMHPKDPMVLNNLASLHATRGDNRALGYAEQAHRLAPKHPAINDTLGWILVRKGNPEQGLKFLREAYSRASREPAVRYHLAVALKELGRTTAAIRELEGLLADGESFADGAAARALLDKLKKP
ncbi:MAG: PEP-CTERM system TPR-repeat protein PrsT, partial [Gammaproteobacteria bacterium]|nr:PEP-CTERM system TPR-repeat protein PrsT [Gammaproteobacteria bacterium]